MLRQLALPGAWLIGRARARRWRGVRFLCYHSILAEQDSALPPQVEFALSTGAFQRHLAFMRDHGYAVISMPEAVALLKSRRAADRSYVCLTFDDGRTDNFTVAWPLLQSFGYSAHFFVSSAFIGQRGYMDADALRSLVREGATLGSHGKNHLNLTRLDDTALREELWESRALLEGISSSPVDTHAYPFARYDARVLTATRAAGYDYAFGVNTGTVVTFKGEADLTIPRNVMRSGTDPAENYAILRGGYDFTRSYSDAKRELRTWLKRN